MRKAIFIFAVLCILTGGLWLLYGPGTVPGIVQQYVENSEITTLKARYTPEQVLDAHSKELLIDDEHTFQEAGIKYHPYLLMDVKYAQADKKTREGVLLWSLVDGEMVLNTETWEQSHGFEDAINADATRHDLRLMIALAKQKGSATLDQLQKELKLEKEALAAWVESALSKHLIMQKGNEVHLHFQDPKILVTPETKVTDWLVKKPFEHTQRVSSQYSPNQIQKIAKAAFGEDFSVRNISEVYLPVYSIIISNPDGSTLTTYWNAMNGKRMRMKAEG